MFNVENKVIIWKQKRGSVIKYSKFNEALAILINLLYCQGKLRAFLFEMKYSNKRFELFIQHQ